MPELWDIYDRNRNLTGRTMQRGEPMLPDDYRLVVQVWIQNSKGKWLLSQRAPNKSQPLKWEPTGGCVQAGETSMQAAIREAREELGVMLKNGRLFRSFRRNDFCWENPGFLDVWFFEKDIEIETVVLQQEEAVGVRWASENEILKMIALGEFVPVHEFPYHRDLFAWSRTI